MPSLDGNPLPKKKKKNKYLLVGTGYQHLRVQEAQEHGQIAEEMGLGEGAEEGAEEEVQV